MSRIIVGLMRIADKNKEEVSSLIHSCIDNGLNYFDLADIYGAGRCEELVGEVLLEEPELRNKMIIQSKVGISKEGGKSYDSSYEYIVNNAKKCIERMHCKYLDCLLIHRPDVLMDASEVARAISDLQNDGLIREFGVSNFNPSEIEYLESELKTHIKYNQIHFGIGNTVMVDQAMYTNVPSGDLILGPDSLLFYLKRKKIAIQAWSPFQYKFFQGSIFDEEKYPQINEVLDKYAKMYNTSKCAIASAFVLMVDKNALLITGSTNINHILEAKNGEEINFTKKDWYRLYNDLGNKLL